MSVSTPYCLEAIAIVFCRGCGIKVPEQAEYCVNCGTAITASQHAVLISGSQTVFSGWITRFVAWLIDVILVSIVLVPVRVVLGLLNMQMPGLGWAPFINLGMDSVFYFLYWTFMEGIYAQSIGKMVVGIKVSTVSGGRINLGTAAIQSLGKAFLLPLDCFLGWILYPTKKQRLFNYLSNTIVS